MKFSPKDKVNPKFFPTAGLILLFIILILTFRNFMSRLDSVLNQDLLFSDVLRSLIMQLIYNFLIIYTIFILAVFLYGVLQNYRQKLLEQNLLLTTARYQIAFKHFAEAIWEYDIASDTMKKSSSETGLFTGITEIPEFRKYMLDSGILHPDDHEAFLRFLDEMLTHDPAPVCTQIRGLTSDQNYTWFELTASKVFNAVGVPVSIIGQTTDISRRKEEEAQQLELAGQDKLTRLYTKNAFAQMVDHYLDSLDYAVISALFLIDIDNFSKINETLGRIFGDAVLLDLSAHLKKKFQPQDIIGRIGGDSFAIFLTNVSSTSYVEECARELCSMLHEIYSGSAAAITGSIGVSIFPSDGNRYDVLAEKASRALYEAKQLGKDRCYIYSDSLSAGTSRLPNYANPEETASCASAYEERSLVNTDMIINAIDILFDSREADISIQMLLSLIGAYYDLDRLSIIEYNPRYQTMSITHEWVSHLRYQLKSSFQHIPCSQEALYAKYKDSENGIFYSDSFLPELQSGMIADPMSNQKPQSVFQCGFSDHGSYSGYICASISDSSHTWNKSDIDSLTLISKIIGSFIVRIRSVRHAAWVTKNDQLTGAYNFNTFLTEVNKLHSGQPKLQLAMMYSDISQFKLANDNYGYQAGDYILKNVADIFRTVCPDGILCRISGDKFALCTPYTDENDLISTARTLSRHCRHLTSEQGDNFRLSLFLGIYIMAPEDTAIIAVDRANIARKNAQRRNISSYAFFTNTMRSSLILQKDLEDAMEDSLLKNDFLVYYQPKFNINTKTLCGAEALVRWQHPTLGFLYPNSFVPLFESNRFIIDLDYFIFEQVCIFIKKKLAKGKELFPISVNFSREHFKSDGLPEKLKAAVDFYNIPASLIEIEITESAFTAIDQHFTGLLNAIRSYGFRLAMDDFGSGLSSLNLLCDLPFNVLKIDKDFFHSKTTTERERIIISNIVRMAGELEMEVICEGVETEEQAQFLKSIGCNMAQGYLFSKPISEKDFAEKYFT